MMVLDLRRIRGKSMLPICSHGKRMLPVHRIAKEDVVENAEVAVDVWQKYGSQWGKPMVQGTDDEEQEEKGSAQVVSIASGGGVP